jgi:hypothetical protein
MVFGGADHAFFNATGLRFNAPVAAEAYRRVPDWFGRSAAQDKARSGRVGGVRVERLEPPVRRPKRVGDVARRAGVAPRDADPSVRANQEEHARPLRAQIGHVPVFPLALGPRVNVPGVEQNAPAVPVAGAPPQTMRLAHRVHAARAVLLVVTAHMTIFGRSRPTLEHRRRRRIGLPHGAPERRDASDRVQRPERADPSVDGGAAAHAVGRPADTGRPAREHSAALTSLSRLHASGVIDDREYAQLRARITA